VEADRLVGARPGDKVIAGRKVEAAAGDIRRRDRGERVERAEPIGAAAARDTGVRRLNLILRGVLPSKADIGSEIWLISRSCQRLAFRLYRPQGFSVDSGCGVAQIQRARLFSNR
jgi:hypothetical protein